MEKHHQILKYEELKDCGGSLENTVFLEKTNEGIERKAAFQTVYGSSLDDDEVK